MQTSKSLLGVFTWVCCTGRCSVGQLLTDVTHTFQQEVQRMCLMELPCDWRAVTVPSPFTFTDCFLFLLVFLVWYVVKQKNSHTQRLNKTESNHQ